MKIRNVTSRDLQIAATGKRVQSGETVGLGKPVAERLLEQTDVWQPGVVHLCPDCDFEAASKGGLTTHRKTHDEE